MYDLKSAAAWMLLDPGINTPIGERTNQRSSTNISLITSG